MGHTVKRAGEATAAIARELAPKSTGALVNAISFKYSKKRGGWKSMVISDMPGNPNWRGQIVPYNVYINEFRVMIPVLMPGGRRVPMDIWGTRKGSRDRRGYMNKAFEYAKETFPKTVMHRIDMVLAGR